MLYVADDEYDSPAADDAAGFDGETPALFSVLLVAFFFLQDSETQTLRDLGFAWSAERPCGEGSPRDEPF